MTEPQGHLRVGNAEREAAIADLQQAAADGKLTPDELDQRVEAALTARTYADLDALLDDLRPPPAEAPLRLQQVEPYPVQGYPPAGYPPPTPSGPPGFSPQDPLIINAGFTGAKKTGPWEIPPFLQVQATADTARIDCLQATARSPIIDLEVLAGLGTVVLVVPEGWGVQVDRLGKSWGTVKSQVPNQAAWGNPLIVVRGSIGMGTFKARGANWLDRRRLGQDR